MDKYRGNVVMKKTVSRTEKGFDMVPYIRQNELLHNFASNFGGFLVFVFFLVVMYMKVKQDFL